MISAGDFRNGKTLEIEGTVLNMISEISHCKTTIESLDTMVADSLKEKLFISGLSTKHEIHSFQQYFGDFSLSSVVGVVTVSSFLTVSSTQILQFLFLKKYH